MINGKQSITLDNPITCLHQEAFKRRVKLLWNLTNEYGPPHNRTFSVTVSINCSYKNLHEVFEGFGKSIKLAKRAAAEIALKNTNILCQTSLDHDKLAQPLKSEACIAICNLLNNVAFPGGCRAELQMVARIFDSPVKFHRLRNAVSGVGQLLIGSIHASLCTQLPLVHRVFVEFIGRQYVGESTTRSGAEQEASEAALKAIRHAILNTINLGGNERSVEISSVNSSSIRPRCPIWRLRVLSALHYERPRFLYSRLQPMDSDEVVHHCSCNLGRWGCIEGTGKSRLLAAQWASMQMIHRLNQRDSQEFPNSTMKEEEVTVPEVGRSNIRKQKGHKNKASVQFKMDRSAADYGKYVNPITRLNYVCAARDLSVPVYELQLYNPIFQMNSSSTDLEFIGCPTISEPYFYTVSVGSRCVHGMAAPSKKLAKRLAAEKMLLSLDVSPHKLLVPSRAPTRPSLRRNAETSSTSDCPELAVDDTSTENQIALTENELVKDRHITFSYTQNVLLLNDQLDGSKLSSSSSGPFLRKSSHSRNVRIGHSRISRRRNMASEASLQHHGRCYASRSSSLGPLMKPTAHDAKPRSVRSASCSGDRRPSRYLRIGSIGHWSGSDEAKTVNRHTSPKHSTSSEMQIPIITSSSSSSGEILTWSVSSKPDSSYSPTQTNSSNTSSSFTLLAQLASLCLTEHFSTTSSGLQTTTGAVLKTCCEGPVKQLTLLCQRLCIPCQFIDFAPKPDWDENHDITPIFNAKRLEHETELILGASVDKQQRTSSSPVGCNKGVALLRVHGSGNSRDAAHEAAALAAFARLPSLIHHA